MKTLLKTLLLLASVSMAEIMNAQSFSNDFENQNEWLQPWFNIHIVADSDNLSGNHVCLCDSIHEYGFGFGINAGTDSARPTASSTRSS